MSHNNSPLLPVASPCNSVCRIDERTGWCLGCCRTLDEIAAWSALADAQKLAVHEALRCRRQALVVGADASNAKP